MEFIHWPFNVKMQTHSIESFLNAFIGFLLWLSSSIFKVWFVVRAEICSRVKTDKVEGKMN